MDDFELPLSCPFTWKPSKICKFWNDLHNHIKPKFENGQRVPAPEITKFCQLIRENARTCDLFGPTKNWGDVLGYHDLELVTRTEINVQSWWGTSVESLLRVIRNKHEHQDGFSDKEKCELGWFQMINGKYEFDETLFASYWITRFPNLLSFLWNQFSLLKASFREYYPDSLAAHMRKLDISLENFVVQLKEACSRQLDQGYLCERFTCESSSCSIELRTLGGELLSRLLNGSSIMEVVISAVSVTIMWDGNRKECLEYKPVCKSNNEKQECWRSGDIGTYIFASESAKVYSAICMDIGNERHSNSRIVIFTTKDAIEGTIGKFEGDSAFQRNSILWWDLSEYTRSHIEFGDEFKFIIQSKEFLFRDLLPNCGKTRNNILSKLKGKILNTLLRTCKLSLLKSHEIPSVDQLYRERFLCNREKLHSSIFQKKSLNNDVFIVLKKGSKPLPTHPPYQVRVVPIEKIFPKLTLEGSYANTVLVGDTEIENLQEALSSFQGWRERLFPINIHFLRYLGEEIFQWIWTAGSLYTVKSEITEAARKAGIMTESEFLKEFDKREYGKRLVFIADQPGMGKSQVLYNFAGKIIKSNEKKIVILICVQQFVDNFVKNYVPNAEESEILNQFIKTIIDITCLERFEKAVISNLLQERSSLVQFEIMLDGLDEVSPDCRKMVLNGLAIIDAKFKLPFRIWITSRDYMLDSIRAGFGTLGYKLDPFSKSEQINFLVNFWSRNLDSCQLHLENLQKFAERCIANCVLSGDAELAGIPLQCRMLGEIYDRQVLNQNFDLEENGSFNLNNLYEKMLERKLEIYIREKKMLPVNISKDDSWVQLTRISIERYLEYLSIELIFGSEVANSLRNILSISAEPHVISTLTKIALEHGVLQDVNPLKFIHRTFAEYLIARHVSNFLLNRNYKMLDDLDKNFLDFLWNYVLAVKHDGKYYGCRFEHPTLCHFLNKALSTIDMAQSSFYDECFRELLGEKIIDGAKYDGIRNSVNFASKFLAADKHFESPLLKPYINIIGLFTHSRVRLSELLCFAVLMEEYAVARYIIKMLDFRPKDWHKIRDISSSKFGILHYLLFPWNPYFDDILDFDGMKSLLIYFSQMNSSLLEERDAKGRTPLLLLVSTVFPFYWKGNRMETMEILRLLISLGGDIHAVDHNKNSVLHLGKPHYDFHENANKCLFLQGPFEYIVLKEFYLEVIRFFLENGCTQIDLNCLNSEGYTPLFSFLEIINKILVRGQSGEVEDFSLKSVLGVLSGVFKLFHEHGNDFNASYMDGETILCKVIKKGFSLFIIEKLIEHGADICSVNINDHQGAIHVAVEMASIHVVKFLIDNYPSCLYFKDGNGKYAMEYESTGNMRKYLQYRITSETSEYMGCSKLRV